jgi:hypothetical protein
MINGTVSKGQITPGGLWVREGTDPKEIQTLVNSEESVLEGRRNNSVYFSLTACATSRLDNVRLLPPNVVLPNGEAVKAIKTIVGNADREQKDIIIYCGCVYTETSKDVKGHATALYCHGQNIGIYDPGGIILDDKYKMCRDVLSGEFRVDFEYLGGMRRDCKLPQGNGGTCSFHTEAFIESANEYISRGAPSFEDCQQQFYSDNFLLESARKVAKKVSRNNYELTDDDIRQIRPLKTKVMVKEEVSLNNDQIHTEILNVSLGNIFSIEAIERAGRQMHLPKQERVQLLVEPVPRTSPTLHTTASRKGQPQKLQQDTTSSSQSKVHLPSLESSTQQESTAKKVTIIKPITPIKYAELKGMIMGEQSTTQTISIEADCAGNSDIVSILRKSFSTSDLKIVHDDSEIPKIPPNKSQSRGLD